MTKMSPAAVELQSAFVSEWSSEEYCCSPSAAAAAEGRMTEGRVVLSLVELESGRTEVKECINRRCRFR